MTHDTHHRRGRRRWRLGSMVAAATLLTLLAIVPSNAASSLAGNSFESNDGNKTCESGTSNVDWNCTNGKVSSTDLTKSTKDNAFGQGTKEDDPAVTVVQGSIPPQKSDLSSFSEWDTKGTNGDQFLYLAWERTNNLGSANMDFELNQKKTTYPSTGKVTINRTAGDLLVTYDFGGSGEPLIGLNRWLTGATTPSVTGFATNVCYKAQSFPCWGDHKDLNGANASATVADGGISSDTLFGETAIDLSLAIPDVFGPNPTTCESIGQAYLKSRSSSSFTSEIKDFVPPADISVSNCGYVLVHKTAADTGANQAGAAFSISPGSTSNGTTATSSSIPGITGHDGYYCVDNLLTGSSHTYTVTEDSAPTGYDVDPNSPWQNVQATAGSCADVTWTTATPPAPTSSVTVAVSASDPAQTGAIFITKVGKDKNCTAKGSPDATCADTSTRLLNGAVFQVFTTDTTPAQVGSDLTTAGTGAKAGFACIDNLPLGTYTVHEKTAPSTAWGKAADQTVTLTAANGDSTCPTSTAAATGTPQKVTFTNTPLSKIEVAFTSSAGTGVTVATIHCYGEDGTTALTLDSGSTSGLDQSYSGLVPNSAADKHYTCTINVDP